MGAGLLLRTLPVRYQPAIRCDAKLTVDDIRLIRELRQRYGLSLREIGNKFEISHEMVDKICKRKSYAEVE